MRSNLFLKRLIWLFSGSHECCMQIMRVEIEVDHNGALFIIISQNIDKEWYILCKWFFKGIILQNFDFIFTNYNTWFGKHEDLIRHYSDYFFISFFKNSRRSKRSLSHKFYHPGCSPGQPSEAMENGCKCIHEIGTNMLSISDL